MPFEKKMKQIFRPTVTSDPLYRIWERPKFENLNFVFAMVKVYSQLPKKELLYRYTKIRRDLQTPWSRFKSQMAYFGQKLSFFVTFGLCGVRKTL